MSLGCIIQAAGGRSPAWQRRKYLRALVSYDGVQRFETWTVPLPVVREAALNAIMPKDYSSGVPVQISVYGDKLMIWNPAQLPPSWPVEKLLGKHSFQPFRPDLANTFFGAGMIEAWGRGIERISEACAGSGTPPPEFRHESTGLWIIFPFAAAVVAEAQEAQVVLSDLARILLAACRLEDQTRKELLAAAEFRTRTGNFKRALKHLKALGFIDLSIPDRPTSNKQRYRTTAAGKAWLAKAPAKGVKR